MSPPEAPDAPENVEWRLVDFLDALAAEVDQAQDTVALKSFSRGLTITVKGLNLDLAVGVRMDSAGRIFFRTVEPGQAPGTLLKLSLEEVLQGQVEEVRRPFDGEGLPLSALSALTPEETAALGRLSIVTVEDLQAYSRTPALIAELARKSGVAEPHLRSSLGLPYLTRIVPSAGAPGQSVVIEGGNLGTQNADDRVLFQAIEARILRWEESRITLDVPGGTGSGPVYAKIDGARSNLLLWQAQPARLDLQVLDLTIEPSSPTAAQEILFGATLVNRGDVASGSFSAEWSINDARAALSEESGLAPGQSRRLELRSKLVPGSYRVCLAADPEGRLPLVDRGKATVERAFTVTAPPPSPRVQVSRANPASAAAGSSLPVVLQGSGFQNGCTVSFGASINVNKVSVESPERITAQIAIAPRAAIGPRDITVTLAGGVGSDPLRGGFTVTAPTAPGDLAVTSLVPDRSRAGILVTVTINGRGFQSGVSASFGLPFVMERISSEKLTGNLTIPPQASGPLTLTLTNPDGGKLVVPGAFQVLG